MSLYGHTFGLALTLLCALVIAVALLYSLALDRLMGTTATRAPDFYSHL